MLELAARAIARLRRFPEAEARLRGKSRCFLVAPAAAVAAATAATAATTTTTTTTTGSWLAWSSLIDRQNATADIGAVDRVNGRTRLVIVDHLNEAKTTRAAGVPVLHHHSSSDLPMGGEHPLEFLIGCRVGEVPHVYLHPDQTLRYLRTPLPRAATPVYRC